MCACAFAWQLRARVAYALACAGACVCGVRVCGVACGGVRVRGFTCVLLLRMLCPHKILFLKKESMYNIYNQFVLLHIPPFSFHFLFLCVLV